MGRQVASLAALVLVGATVFALAPADPERHIPDVPAVAVEPGSGTLVVDLVDGASAHDLEAIEGVLGADLEWVHPLAVDEALAVGHVSDMPRAVALLAGNPLVEVVEPEMSMRMLGNYPNDPALREAMASGGDGSADGMVQHHAR